MPIELTFPKTGKDIKTVIKLSLIRNHLDDQQMLNLTYSDPIEYGFSRQEVSGV